MSVRPHVPRASEREGERDFFQNILFQNKSKSFSIGYSYYWLKL